MIIIKDGVWKWTNIPTGNKDRRGWTHSMGSARKRPTTSLAVASVHDLHHLRVPVGYRSERESE